MTSNIHHFTLLIKSNLLFLVLLLFAIGLTPACRDQQSSTNEPTEELATADGTYEDGTYCAEVEYYNPNTRTRSTYSLNVEVENNELTLIHWPNGGWLDDSHFTPVELDESGYCSFTSDRGYEYEVQITGPECSYDDSSRARRDAAADEEEVTCPKCGNEKETYDKYCQSCTDDIENTCSRCGSFEYNVNGGLCSSCQSEEDEKEDFDE